MIPARILKELAEEISLMAIFQKSLDLGIVPDDWRSANVSAIFKKGFKVSKGAKIRNRYNQVPHLTQDTNGKVTNSQQTPQTIAKRSALS